MRNAKRITISPQASIREALEAIDRGTMQIALIVENEILLGTITDGDIRRAFLQGKTLSDSIKGIFNASPVKGIINQPREDLLQMALAKEVKQIPMVDDAGHLIGIECIDDYLRVTEKPNTVILMAGGLGSRLRPLTIDTPKPMLAVGSKPILETIIESFSRYGFRNFYLSVNYMAEKIRDHFGDGKGHGVSISYLNEKNRLGTAGALSLLPDDTEAPLIVMNGDILTNVNFEHLLNYHMHTGADATMCVREYEFQVPYGVVHTKGAAIHSITEKPTHQFYVNAGIYVLSPQVLSLIPKGKFFDMPQLFQELIGRNKKTCSFPIREYWMDIGQPNDFEKANSEYEEVFDV